MPAAKTAPRRGVASGAWLVRAQGSGERLLVTIACASLCSSSPSTCSGSCSPASCRSPGPPSCTRSSGSSIPLHPPPVAARNWTGAA
uniref:Uncharacterized protein n=1 Tax=Arundo donax TaxID=35708 RepID=A0A0A9AJF0_ARUDO